MRSRTSLSEVRAPLIGTKGSDDMVRGVQAVADMVERLTPRSDPADD